MTSAYESPSEAPPPLRKSWWPWVLVGGGLLFLIPCVCSGLVVAVIGRGVATAVVEHDDAELVVNNYFRLMKNQDIEGAYELFSLRARQTIPQSDLEKLARPPNDYLFSDFEKAAVLHIQIQYTSGRTLAHVRGTANFSNGIVGTFQGTLEREGDDWRILSMNVFVPPSKLPTAEAK